MFSSQDRLLMHIYLVIYFLGTIPFVFTSSLSAKHTSLLCFSEGKTEIASELAACSKLRSGSVTQQQSSSNSRQVYLCFIRVSFQKKTKQVRLARRKSSKQMNNLSQADAVQNLVQIPTRNDKQWMPDPHLILKRFILCKSPGRLLSVVHNSSFWVSSSPWWDSRKKHGTSDTLVAILLLREHGPSCHDVNEQLGSPQCFPVWRLPFMSLVIHTDPSVVFTLLPSLVLSHTFIPASPGTTHLFFVSTLWKRAIGCLPGTCLQNRSKPELGRFKAVSRCWYACVHVYLLCASLLSMNCCWTVSI